MAILVFFNGLLELLMMKIIVKIKKNHEVPNVPNISSVDFAISPHRYHFTLILFLYEPQRKALYLHVS